MYLKVFTSLVKLQNPSQRVSVPLPAKFFLSKYEWTKSNTNTADVTSAYRDDKQMQILSILLLPMKMIENGSTANVTPAYEDDMKDADVTPAYEDDMEAADVTPASEDDNQLNFVQM